MAQHYGNQDALRRLAGIEAKLPAVSEVTVDGKEYPYWGTSGIGLLGEAISAWVTGRTPEGPLADAFIRGELPADAAPLDRLAQDAARLAAYGPPIPPELIDTGLPPDVDQDENEDGAVGAAESGSQPL